MFNFLFEYVLASHTVRNKLQNILLGVHQQKKKKVVEEPGFEPGTFRMRSGHSTTELHPRCYEISPKRKERMSASGTSA